MLNLTELERRWIKYKIKSYAPHTIIGLSTVIIIFILVFFIDNKDFQKSVQKPPKTVEKKIVHTVKKPISPKKIITMPVPVPSIIKKEITTVKQIKLSPSLNFMHSMHSSSLPYDEDTVVPQEKTKPVQKEILKEEIITPKAPKQQNISMIVQKEQSSKITIKKRDTMNDIHTIIKRFQKNNNPGLSLFIAKKYYEIGDYEKAYNYALITNKINNKIEESWIIFSKSIFKLGKKEDAMKTLKKYIKSSYSSNAKLLLEDMRSGKFQ